MRTSCLLIAFVAALPVAAQQPQSPILPGAPNHAPLFQLPNPGAPRFQWNPNLALRPRMILPLSPPARDAQIDPGILLRPAPNRIGALAPGHEIASNQFPGLRFQPIDTAKPSLEKIPTQWPLLKVEQIPTRCAACSLDPAQQAVQTPESPK